MNNSTNYQLVELFNFKLNNSTNYQLAYFFLAFFAWLYTANSQERVLIEGQIVSDSIPVAGIHIVNLTSETGTSSDIYGKFDMYVTVNDTLLISSVQFENREIRVRQVNFDQRRIEIQLYPARNELDEIKLSDINLTGRLTDDVDKIKYVDRTKFGLPYNKPQISQTDRRIYTATTSAGGIPLDLFLNTLNGKIAMLKKVKANDDLKNLVIRAEANLPKSFFLEDLGIPETELQNFLYYCARKPELKRLIASDNLFGQIEFYKAQVAEFKKIRDLTND